MAHGHKKHSISCLSEIAGVLACKHAYPIKQVKGVRRSGRIRFDGLEIKSPKILQGVRATSLKELVQRMKEHDRLVLEGPADTRPIRKNDTFRTLDEGVRILRQLNPQLDTLIGNMGSRMDVAYSAWVRGGRRGPKPTPENTLGRPSGDFTPRFDWIFKYADDRSRNQKRRLDRFRHSVTSWTEALHVLMPKSRKWADLEERMPDLEEAIRAEGNTGEFGTGAVTVESIVVPGEIERLDREHQQQLHLEAASFTVKDIVDQFRETDNRSRQLETEREPEEPRQGWTRIDSGVPSVRSVPKRTPAQPTRSALPAHVEPQAYETPTPPSLPSVPLEWTDREAAQAEREAATFDDEDRRERHAIQHEHEAVDVPDDSDLPF